MCDDKKYMLASKSLDFMTESDNQAVVKLQFITPSKDTTTRIDWAARYSEDEIFFMGRKAKKFFIIKTDNVAGRRTQ